MTGAPKPRRLVKSAKIADEAAKLAREMLARERAPHMAREDRRSAGFQPTEAQRNMARVAIGLGMTPAQTAAGMDIPLETFLGHFTLEIEDGIARTGVQIAAKLFKKGVVEEHPGILMFLGRAHPMLRLAQGALPGEAAEFLDQRADNEPKVVDADFSGLSDAELAAYVTPRAPGGPGGD